MIYIEEIEKKGFVAEHIVMVDLVRGGFIPCAPEITSSPFDILAVRGNEYIKVQVKGFTFADKDRYKLTIKRPSSKQGKYQKDDYHILAIVETDEMKVAYFPFMDKYQVTMYKDRPIKLSGAQTRNEINVFYDHSSIEEALEVWKERRKLDAN